MKRTLPTSLMALFIAMLFMGFQCNEEAIPPYVYNFSDKVELFPAQKSYKLGDTIWIQYSNPDKKLFDNLSGQEIPVDSVSFNFFISLTARYGVPFLPVDGLCDFISARGVNEGRFVGPGNGTGFQDNFGCNSGNSQDFKVGIVPKLKGIFSLGFRQEEYLQTCPSRISAFPNASIAYKFNLADCNKEIYLAIPPEARGESERGYTERQIDNKELYILKVE